MSFQLRREEILDASGLAAMLEESPARAAQAILLAAGEGEGQVLTFTTNVGDEVAAGPGNPIRVERDLATGEPSPYVHVRRGLEARIDRKTFYRLVERGTHRDGWFGLWSGGVFFAVIPSNELA